MSWELGMALVGLIFLLATATKVMFGFGEALVAMPLLTLFLTAPEATPIVSLGSLISTSLLAASDWRHMEVRVVRTMLLFGCVGIPLGLVIVKLVDDRLVRLLLAAVIFGYASFSLWRPHLFRLANDRTLPWFSIVAGALGGAYNTHGPPLVIYGTMRRWEPLRFRANLQAYFLPAGLCVAIAHGLAGLWTPQVLWYVVAASCVSLPTVLIGRRVHRKLPPRDYSRYIYMLLMVLALVLGVRAAWEAPPPDSIQSEGISDRSR